MADSFAVNVVFSDILLFDEVSAHLLEFGRADGVCRDVVVENEGYPFRVPYLVGNLFECFYCRRGSSVV